MSNRLHNRIKRKKRSLKNKKIKSYLSGL